MKNLKRVLSLALATVMLFGMMVVGANASFADQSQIKYTDAVDTLTGLGVINGMTSTTFVPNGTLTRAQGARLVAMVKAGSNETTLGYYDNATKFKDVTSNHGWALGSINYCVANGIIAGETATTFNPDGTLTGAALAKMMLVALGYPANSADSSQALTGSNWQLNAIRLATEAGLFEKLDSSFSATKAVTREEATQIMYNALFLNTWVLKGYQNNIPVYEKTGANLLTSAFKATGVDGTDAYGRPATVYTSTADPDLKVTVSEKPILTYTTGVTGYDLNTAIANAGYKLDTTAALVYSRNGGTGSYSASEVAGIVGDKTTKLGGNGIVLEVYADAKTKTVDKLVIVVTYLSKVTAYAKDNAATTNLDERTLTIARVNSGSAMVITPKTTTNFNAIYDAYVANLGTANVTYVTVVPQYDNSSTGAALDAALATPTVGTLTSVSGAISFVAGGTNYQYSKTKDATTNPLITETGITVTSTYLSKNVNVYTDAYGYVLAVTPVKEEASSNYALVMQYDGATMAGQQTKLLLADGTYKVVNAKVGTPASNTTMTEDTPADATETKVAKNTAVSYREIDGVYYLTVLGAASPTDYGKQTVATIEKGNATVGISLYADSKTVFVTVDDKGAVTTYTGIANVPNTTGTMIGIGKGQTVSFVFVVGATVSANTAKDLIYVFDTNYSVSGTADKPLYTYNALKDGQITTVAFSVDVHSKIDAKDIYEVTKYDADGHAADVADAGTPYTQDLTTGTKVTYFANDTLVAGTSYVVNSSTLFVNVDPVTNAMTVANSTDITVESSEVVVVPVVAADNTATGVAAIVFIVK